MNINYPPNEINICPPVIFALLLSGLWFVSRFDTFRNQFKKINDLDEKGILLPSLSIITSPFILTYITCLLRDDNFDEILQFLAPVVTILTFCLGQLYESKQQEKKEQKKEYIFRSEILDLLEYLIFRIDSLTDIATQLIEDPNFDALQSSQSISPEVKNIFNIINLDETKERINRVLNNDLIHSTEYGIRIKFYLSDFIRYFDHIKNEKYLSSNVQLSPSYPNLIIWKDVMTFIINGYEVAILLIGNNQEIVNRLKSYKNELFELIEYNNKALKQNLISEQNSDFSEQKDSYLNSKRKKLTDVINYINRTLTKFEK